MQVARCGGIGAGSADAVLQAPRTAPALSTSASDSPAPLNVRLRPSRLRAVLDRADRLDPVVPDADGGDRLAALFADRQRARSRPDRARAVRADDRADPAGRSHRRPLRPSPDPAGLPARGSERRGDARARHRRWAGSTRSRSTSSRRWSAQRAPSKSRPWWRSFPGLVPRVLVPAATAWFATANQAGQIVGPVLGGLLYGLRPRRGLWHRHCALGHRRRLHRHDADGARCRARPSRSACAR